MTPTHLSPNARELLQDRAYDYLIEQIQNKRFTPGKIYSERQISAEIGISRTPFKDALTRLSVDKYIDIVPSKGFRLHTISKNDVLDTYQIRTAIEGYCAIHLMNRNETTKGKACIEKMAESINLIKRTEDKLEYLPEFLDAENKFHFPLVEFSNNNVFISLYSSYQHQILTLASESLISNGRMSSTIQEHEDILNAIMGHDESKVYNTIRTHMRSGRDININNFT